MSDKWKALGNPDWRATGCSLGDDQAGGEASVAFVTTEPHNGRYRVMIHTYGVCSVKGQEEDFDNPVGPFVVIEQQYVGTCRDLADIGGTEEEADYDYEEDYASFDTLASAEARARELAESTMSPNEYWLDPWAGA